MSPVLELSPAMLDQLEPSVPEEVWVWGFGPVDLSTRHLAGLEYCELSISSDGITNALRKAFGMTNRDGDRITDGNPRRASYPGDFPNAGNLYDGFILYDDNGQEIKRWVVR